MKAFMPERIYIEPRAYEYPLGKKLYDYFSERGVEINETTSHNQVRNLPGDNDFQKYRNAKSTLVVGVRKTLKFDTSKPSAEYALPLATGCMGHCHYCYLQTTMGSKPYIRTYVNTDEILARADEYMNEHAPKITRFEASCTSDIVGIDHLTHSLKSTIEHMAKTDHGVLRFVTKFEHVDHLLDADHRGKTRFRFSVNANFVIKYFEPGTSSLDKRIELPLKFKKRAIPLDLSSLQSIFMMGGKKAMNNSLKHFMKSCRKVGATTFLLNLFNTDLRNLRNELSKKTIR